MNNWILKIWFSSNRHEIISSEIIRFNEIMRINNVYQIKSIKKENNTILQSHDNKIIKIKITFWQNHAKNYN